MKKILNSLAEGDYVLILETSKDRMEPLDEDDLIALHTRIRRARDKHTKNYRRSGSVKVAAKRGRGSGKSANTRNADKAEVFEDALSRVSRRLAVVSRQSASTLKAERLQRARSDAPDFSGAAAGNGEVATTGRARVDKTRASSGRKKREASSIAAGARRQAKKDGR